MPRAIKHARIVRLKSEFLQPGVLWVVDEQIRGGRAGHGTGKEELQTKKGTAAA